MNKSILFVAPSAYPFGGVADWLAYVLPGLESRGWTCTLGLVAGKHHQVHRYLERHPFGRVHQIVNPSGSPEGRVRAVQSAIDNTSPDVVATINIVDVYEAVRRIRQRGSSALRLVTTLHGLQDDLLADIAFNRDVIDAVVSSNRLSQALVVEALGGAGLILSQHNKADSADPFSLGERVGVRDLAHESGSRCNHPRPPPSPSGSGTGCDGTRLVDSFVRSLYAPYGVALPTDLNRNPDRTDCIRLLYSGRVEQEQKRVLDLPPLLSALRGRDRTVQLVIAGDGLDAQRLKEAFASAGVSDCVRWAGVLDRGALAQQYRESDALIITSDWETGPIVAWEAMANRLPVVSSAYVGAGRERALVDGQNCLLFAVGDTEAAASKVMELQDDAIRNRLTDNAYQTVLTRYTLDTSFRAWADAFGHVLQLPVLPCGTELASTSPPPLSGRLDRFLGPRFGETVRATLGVAYEHASAGAEWPHTRQSSADATAFLAQAARVDRQLPADCASSVTSSRPAL